MSGAKTSTPKKNRSLSTSAALNGIVMVSPTAAPTSTALKSACDVIVARTVPSGRVMVSGKAKFAVGADPPAGEL